MLRNVRAKPRETAATGGIPPSQRTVPQREHTQKRSVSRFRTQARKRPTPRNRRTGRADKEPQFAKKRFFVPMCPMNTTEKGAKTKLFGNFSDVKKSDETFIFVAFRKFLKFPGSLSALRGLLISPLGVRKRAPYHPTRIYIYIYIHIYGCGAICRSKFCHFYRFFPQFFSKTLPKRDVANLPRLCSPPVN